MLCQTDVPMSCMISICDQNSLLMFSNFTSFTYPEAHAVSITDPPGVVYLSSMEYTKSFHTCIRVPGMMSLFVLNTG